jgi:hypothetical protein
MSNDFAGHDDLEMEFDLTHVNRMEDLGKTTVPTGVYHVIVEKVTRDTIGAEKNPIIKFQFRIVAGTHPEAVNRVCFENLWLTDKQISKQRVNLWAGRFGLIDKADLKQKTRRSWASAVDRHMIIKVEERTYTDKGGGTATGSQCTFDGVWPVGHPDAPDCPLNGEALAEAGIPVPEKKPQATQANGAAGQTQAGAATGGGAFDDV